MFRKKRVFYGWIIVAVSFVNVLVVYGIWHSFSLFYLPILEEFGWSRAETAIIFSVGSVTYGLSSFAAGALFDALGPRKSFPVAITVLSIGLAGCSQASEIWQLCVGFGVFAAFGVASIGLVPTTALISNWFARRRATAIGIALAGGRETFLLMPLIQLLIINLSWRGAYLTLAIIAPILVIPLTLALLRHRPQDKGLLPDGLTEAEERQGRKKEAEKDSTIIDKEWASTDWTLLKGMKRYRFWTLFGMMITTGTAYGIVLTHQVAFIVDIGLTQMFAAFLLLIYGIAATSGRTCGFIADLMKKETAFTIGCGGIILGIFMILLARYTSAVWMLYVYITLFGFSSGLNTPAYTSAAADLFQGRHFGAILGFANIGYGLGSSLGSWLAGYIFDVNGDYTLAFSLAMLAVVFTCAGIWIASPRKIRLASRRVRASRI